MQVQGVASNQKQESPNSNSNQFRISQQLSHLCPWNWSIHKPTITRISKNRAQIKQKYEVQNKNNFEQKLVFQESLYDEEQDMTIEFSIVLHEMYPLCPPLVLCCSQAMFPRLDDSRDFLEDVIEGEWWPNITVTQILTSIPKFLQKLFPKYPSHSIRTSFQLGKRAVSTSIPHCMDCLLRNSKGLTLCHAEYYNSQYALIGKYEKIVVGLSWSDIVVFKKIQIAAEPAEKGQDDKYYLVRKWGVRNIRKIVSKKKGTQKHNKTNKILDLNDRNIKEIRQQIIEKYQFCIILKDQKKQYIKIKFYSAQNIEANSKKQLSSHRYMKSKSLNISLQFQQRIQKCQKENQNQQKIKEKCEKMQKNMDPQHSQVNIKLQQTKRNNQSLIIQQQVTPTTADPPLVLPLISPSHSLSIFRHIIQYIQLRECVLATEQSFESKIRMISQIIENSCELQEQIQLQMYYQAKLKEAIANQYLTNSRNQVQSLTSKFQFDI